MNKDEIASLIGPCGLSCNKCFAFKNGNIKFHAANLKNELGNFEIYAKRFSTLLEKPVFEKYPEFKEMLDFFTSAECKGCRKETCKLFKNCLVRDCSREKQVDFCFNCNEFPCQKTGFDEHLHKRSITINMRIKEIGIEEYFNEIKDKPRYQ